MVQSVSKTGAWLAVILSGQIGVLELLFEGSGNEVSTGSAILLNVDDPVARSCNLCAVEAAKSYGTGRLFEIGAGTGRCFRVAVAAAVAGAGAGVEAGAGAEAGAGTGPGPRPGPGRG